MTDATRKSTVLILGGRSEIGLAIGRVFAAEGHNLILAARDPESLEPERADIALRHDIEVKLTQFDVLDTESMHGFVEALDPAPEIVVSVIGLMGEQAENERDPIAATQVMRSNYEGPALILGLFAERMVAAKKGTIVGVSSVAGDRGRASNYVYGSAKAGFTAFLSGLRNRCARLGVQVVTVKPGFVATRMTEGMDLPAALTAAPEEVGQAVLRAVERGRDVVYVRPVWGLVMRIITAIPERFFKRTDL
ncbi:short-chain dehydrogenase [Roseivivax halodurans JCM 10272]|uniref:Short-chain dehydrogenase n=1 Tax=Roseivivax halodurans JCM 10272 TaxID=1449350 RepID=X7E4L5_9RHOB|nr:SDR family oxidoreductase [Roseivivax halodurans]ETX10989.1 short-chain dehydrogenase [Roseivivax halodurans JCM 10272]